MLAMMGSKGTLMPLSRRTSVLVCNCARPRRLFHITRLHSHEPSVTVTSYADPPGTVTGNLDSSSQQDAEAAQQEAPQQHTAQESGHALRRRLQEQAGRKLFYPSERTLRYLDGSLPGDYGWDPLGLGDPSTQGADAPIMNLNWLSYAELIHGRWAIIATAGALAPELLAQVGATPSATGLPWFEAGGLYRADGSGVAVPFFGDVPFHYWTDQYTLLFTMLIAMGFAETRRLQDYRHPGSMGQQYFIGLERVLGGSGDPKYPGGQFFNLAGLARNDNKEMFRLKTAEIKHSRLAMVAWLGIMVQAQSTHMGPIKNLMDHITNPGANNAFVAIGEFVQQTSNAERFGYMLWLAIGFAAGAVYKSAMDDKAAAETASS